jgi:hypothetical protein
MSSSDSNARKNEREEYQAFLLSPQDKERRKGEQFLLFAVDWRGEKEPK